MNSFWLLFIVFYRIILQDIRLQFRFPTVNDVFGDAQRLLYKRRLSFSAVFVVCSTITCFSRQTFILAS